MVNTVASLATADFSSVRILFSSKHESFSSCVYAFTPKTKDLFVCLFKRVDDVIFYLKFC